MKSEDKRLLFSVFINEKDQYHKKPLYMQMLKKLYDAGVTGATVVPALAAYGGEFEIKRRNLFLPWRKNRSLVLYIAEKKEMKSTILQILDEMMQGGIVTIQEGDFIRYTPTVITREDKKIAMKSSGSVPSSLLHQLDK